MITVGNDEAVVEADLFRGDLSCPCGGMLGGHGWAVLRSVFEARGLEPAPGLPGREPAKTEARPRRTRCRSCGATHVLLPARLLSRRCDSTAVIGDMIVRAATGQGPVRIADETGVPEGTVRDRLGRFRGHAGRVRAFFTALAGALSPDPVPLDPAGRTPLADAAASVGAAFRRRRPGGRRSRCRRGSSRRCRRWGRCCPRWRCSGWFAVTRWAPGCSDRSTRTHPGAVRARRVTLGAPAGCGRKPPGEKDTG